MRYLLIVLLLFLGCEEDPVSPIYGCTNQSACNFNPNATIFDDTCEYSEENYDCDGNCTIEADCLGVCGGTAVIDECGVCDGSGIDNEACDCNANILDCAGVCGGTSVEDDCGVCDGSGIDNGACDCNANILDCAGVCGGTSVEDDCGVCDGNNADLDDCGVCDGNNADLDDCGVCFGDNESCTFTLNINYINVHLDNVFYNLDNAIGNYTEYWYESLLFIDVAHQNLFANNMTLPSIHWFLYSGNTNMLIGDISQDYNETHVITNNLNALCEPIFTYPFIYEEINSNFNENFSSSMYYNGYIIEWHGYSMCYDENGENYYSPTNIGPISDPTWVYQLNENFESLHYLDLPYDGLGEFDIFDTGCDFDQLYICDNQEINGLIETPINGLPYFDIDVSNLNFE